MPSSRFGQPSSWIPFDVTVLSSASKFLMVYGALTLLACGLTYLFSLSDVRALREVGIWVKPMKFMAATALFAWTTVWVTELVNAPLTHGQAYRGICIPLQHQRSLARLHVWPHGHSGGRAHRSPSCSPQSAASCWEETSRLQDQGCRLSAGIFTRTSVPPISWAYMPSNLFRCGASSLNDSWASTQHRHWPLDAAFM